MSEKSVAMLGAQFITRIELQAAETRPGNVKIMVKVAILILSIQSIHHAQIRKDMSFFINIFKACGMK